MKIGILPLARATFDVDFAAEKLAAMLQLLDGLGHQIAGPRDLLFDDDATRAAIAQLQAADIDLLLVLQVTFTDAQAIVAAGAAFDQPLAIWAVPEPRNGGRLRLNSFCGLNLASHALGLGGRRFSWLYAAPDPAAGDNLRDLLAGRRRAGRTAAQPATAEPDASARAAAASLRGKRIGRIGQHPPGFDTCAYDDAALRDLAGVTVEAMDLNVLFTGADVQNSATVAASRELAMTTAPALDTVDQPQLDKSLRLHGALSRLGQQFDAFAIRCWPEMFTEYGGAVCGPAAMMGEVRTPCACEADVYGAVTQLLLQEVARAPVFLTDLVDVDTADDSAVVWHCGQAPASMRTPGVAATATVHTNRKMPLLFEFPLKPGRVTLMRISQALGSPKMLISTGDMLARPMAFTGTSGQFRPDRGAARFLNGLIDCGAEHHMALAYGDHADALRGVAAALELPICEF